MSITRNTPWRHISAVPYAIWKKRITDAGGLSAYATYDVWLAAGDDSALMLEFLREESSYASDFEAIPASWNNAWNLQVAGVGLKFDSAEDAALAWRARLYDPHYKQGIYLRTQTISDLISVYAPKSDGNDTEGYITGVVNGMNRNGFDPDVEVPTTPEVPIVAVPIKRQMIPAGNDNRPGSKLNNAPLYITIHDTGNPSAGADAQMHADFVENGGGSESVSFHGTVDDHEAIQLLPADEVGWHAGDGCNSRVDDLGCFQSFAIEMCVNSDGNWSATKRNLVDFVAAIITGDPRIDFAGRKGQFSVDRIVQHNRWSGKHCPAKIRNEGSWNSLLAQIRARVAEIEGGTTPAPEPEPTEPDIVPGVDWGIAKRAFDNPELPGYVLTKGGPLSTAYIERAKTTGQWPQLTDRWPYENGARVYYRFANGDLALFTDTDKKIRWIGDAA